MTRILYIEDEEEIRDIKALNFRRMGYEVDAVASVREAQAAFQENRPDIIITDYNLRVKGSQPEPTGLDFVRWLRHEGNEWDIPVLLHCNKDLIDIKPVNSDFSTLKVDYLPKLESFVNIGARIKKLLMATQPGINKEMGDRAPS